MHLLQSQEQATVEVQHCIVINYSAENVIQQNGCCFM